MGEPGRDDGPPTVPLPGPALGAAPDHVSGVHDPIGVTRPYDRPGGLAYADQRDQWSLEDVVPKAADGHPARFPDPEGEWTAYVNDGGPDVERFRGNNCLDCSMAAIATYHGVPTVAAPRIPDREPDGGIDDWTGERDGPRRAERWIEGRYEHLGLGDAGFTAIERKLRAGGHGSSAAIISSWSAEAGGGAHAWNAFNYQGKITWYDPQRGVTADQPVYRAPLVRSVAAICIGPEGKQL